jgi:predicted DNA binding protein
MRHTKTNEFIGFYSEIGPKKVQLLIRINPDTDKIIGRALVWHLDSGETYLDRIYVADNKDEILFIAYAKKNLGVKHTYQELSSNQTVTIDNWKERKTMPYMDTFRKGLKIDNKLILFNSYPDIEDKYPDWESIFTFESTHGEPTKKMNVKIAKNIKYRDELTAYDITKKYPWLLDADFEFAELGQNTFGLVWYDGTWNSGTWEDGTWEKGTWKFGTWKNGDWYDGIWEGGIWKHGTWEKGTWEKGTWKGGIWDGGTWEKGTWEDGTWEKGTWKFGTWEKGIWRGGTWKFGTWEKGIWRGGTWEDGTWEDGTWLGGTWLDKKNPRPDKR